MDRPLRPLAALAAIALFCAGCGSEAQSDSGAAGGSGASSSTGSGAGAGTTKRDQGVKFAECLRTNGVRDFPDPNAKGEFAYGISVSPEVFRQAVDACKDLQPPGSLSSTRSPKEQSATLEFARCMRGNGVKDFPDPANGEPLVDTTKIPSTEREGGMTILNAAMHTCRRVMAQAVADQ